MAHTKSALKRIRQSRKRRLYNREWKQQIKNAVKAVRSASTYEEAAEKLQHATKVLDKTAAKRIIHKNTVAHKKSSLAKFVNRMQPNASA